MLGGGGGGGREGRRRSGFLQTRDVVLLPPRRCNSVQTYLLAFHWAAVEQKARDLWTETTDSPAGLSGLFCFVRGKAGTVAAGASSACVPGFYLWNPVGAARMDT